MGFHTDVAALLEERHLAVTAVSVAAGLSRSALSNNLRRHEFPRPPELDKLATTLDVGDELRQEWQKEAAAQRSERVAGRWRDPNGNMTGRPRGTWLEGDNCAECHRPLGPRPAYRAERQFCDPGCAWAYARRDLRSTVPLKRRVLNWLSNQDALAAARRGEGPYRTLSELARQISGHLAERDEARITCSPETISQWIEIEDRCLSGRLLIGLALVLGITYDLALEGQGGLTGDERSGDHAPELTAEQRAAAQKLATAAAAKANRGARRPHNYEPSSSQLKALEDFRGTPRQVIVTLVGQYLRWHPRPTEAELGDLAQRALAKVCVLEGGAGFTLDMVKGAMRPTLVRRGIVRPSGGRPSTIDHEGISAMRTEGLSWPQIARRLGKPEPTVRTAHRSWLKTHTPLKTSVQAPETPLKTGF